MNVPYTDGQKTDKQKTNTRTLGPTPIQVMGEQWYSMEDDLCKGVWSYSCMSYTNKTNNNSYNITFRSF